MLLCLMPRLLLYKTPVMVTLSERTYPATPQMPTLHHIASRCSLGGHTPFNADSLSNAGLCKCITDASYHHWREEEGYVVLRMQHSVFSVVQILLNQGLHKTASVRWHDNNVYFICHCNLCRMQGNMHGHQG